MNFNCYQCICNFIVNFSQLITPCATHKLKYYFTISTRSINMNISSKWNYSICIGQTRNSPCASRFCMQIRISHFNANIKISPLGWTLVTSRVKKQKQKLSLYTTPVCFLNMQEKIFFVLCYIYIWILLTIALFKCVK